MVKTEAPLVFDQQVVHKNNLENKESEVFND